MDASASLRLCQSELLHAREGVFKAPRLDDAAFAQPVDANLVDAVESVAGRGLSAPFPEVSARAPEAPGDLVPLGNQR
jgi:hypothetical protein